MDEVEKMVSSTEENEEEDEDTIKKEDVTGDEEEEGDGDEEEHGCMGKKEEAVPHEKNMKLPVQSKEKKEDQPLNLNNEVVKMRKEVKKIRVLIIRKLTRQIAALKKKKGKEMDIERNQRRAARSLEEIHAMKVLAPDLVTKTALQKSLNFEQVCKNPKSTISDRAIARIATHPQFNKKIEDIKAAVNAFKEERTKAGKQEVKEKVQSKAVKVTPQSPDKNRETMTEKEKEDITVEKTDGGNIFKDTKDKTVAESEKETVMVAADTADGQRMEMPEAKNVRPDSLKNNKAKDIVKNQPQHKLAEKKPNLESVPEVFQKKEEESDLELSDDEEKEYFDDSTEERFNKQSSQSEESDDDNGFFVGKVSKFKKKKQQQKSVEEEKADKGREVKSSDRIQSELDELESRLKSKTPSLQSVFCSALSSSKPGGGRGRGRGRGGDRFRGQGKPRGGSGLNRDSSKQSKFQKQDQGVERNPSSKYSKTCSEGRQPDSSEKGFASVGRGRGRGRGDVVWQNDRRGGGAFTHQAPQQALHPSWEASKKRKEQQGQILAFQGKKIKFDD